MHAYVEDSTITAGGTLSQTAPADENIKAAVLALSAAVAPGGVGVAVSGVGSVAINEITSEVDSYIDNSTVTAGSVDLTADDTSQIMAFTGAASVAAASAAWA